MSWRNAVLFTGAVAAILVVHGCSMVWYGDQKWSTAAAGAAYVVGTAAASLLAGLLVLWVSFALRYISNRRQHRQAKQKGGMLQNVGHFKGLPRTAASTEQGDGTIKQPLLTADAEGQDGVSEGGAHTCIEGVKNGNADPIEAVTVSWGNGNGSGGSQVHAKLILQSSSTSNGTETTSGHQQNGTDTDREAVHAITLGRPPIQQLISSCLATWQQLPHMNSGEAARAVIGVYAMGPGTMVGAVQLLCDGHNRHTRSSQPYLAYQQKTHEL